MKFLFLLVPVLAAAQVVPTQSVPTFKIRLEYDNSNCNNANACTADVFRTVCNGIANCPDFNLNSSVFSLIPLQTNQTVTATNTHFVSIDTGASPFTFAFNTVYEYAVRNTYTATPTQPGPIAWIAITTPTGNHTAVINWSNPSCRTATPCTLQVYRATCSSPTTCPVYSPGSSAWKALDMSVNLVPTIGSQGTSWVYTDGDPALTGSTTYVWTATNSYQGSTSASVSSQVYTGTTTVSRSITVKMKKETK